MSHESVIEYSYYTSASTAAAVQRVGHVRLKMILRSHFWTDVQGSLLYPEGQPALDWGHVVESLSFRKRIPGTR